MRVHGLSRRCATTGAVAVALGVALVTASTARGDAVVTSQPVAHQSGTLSVAWPVGTFATSIFPFDDAANYTQVNVQDFQNLMYRPLYWFGLGTSIAEQPALSLANAPVFSVVGGNTQVKITLKGWVFSNGTSPPEAVNAQAVEFWLNLDAAEGAANFWGYVPNYGIPSQVTNVTTPNGPAGNVIDITFSGTVNDLWVMDNYLSEIVPLPLAWDVTSLSASPGTGGCGTSAWGSAALTTACDQVWTFLNGQNQLTTSYTTSGLWSWVDGPYRLYSFMNAGGAPNGNDVLMANAAYSGPQPSLVESIAYRPFATLAAEVNLLASNSVDVGYADPSVVPGSATPPCTAGQNSNELQPHDHLQTVCPWAFGYAFYNFGGATSTRPSTAVPNAELNQLYVRRALQMGIDQQTIIQVIYDNYAVGSFSPIPMEPTSTFQSGVGDPDPYNLANASTLLANNGWADVNGVMECTAPGTGAGKCGAGIPLDSPLQFTYIYPTGNVELAGQLQVEQGLWASEGISVTLTPEPPSVVNQTCLGGQAAWEICQDNDWSYTPDVYPSDELLYHAGNPGGYQSSTLTQLLQGVAAQYTPNAVQPGPATSDAEYQAAQLPVMFQLTQLPMIETNIAVTGSQLPNGLGDFNPEYDSI
jgi:peptide/nickel transport system substrate-binding protein